jgi:hypothetical protein
MLLAAGSLALAACSSDPNVARTDGAYCAAVSTNLTALNAPSIATPADVDATVRLYQAMAKAAPLAVEKEWDILAIAYETASSIVPDDAASVQKAADTIRSSQQAATVISDYTLRLCRTQIGTPTVPVITVAAPTTTS